MLYHIRLFLLYAPSVVLLLGITPAVAQQVKGGRVAESSVGVAGQRQSRDQAMPGVVSTTRINGRIESRIQSRIRSRIDRGSVPQTDALASFKGAADQPRRARRQEQR